MEILIPDHARQFSCVPVIATAEELSASLNELNLLYKSYQSLAFITDTPRFYECYSFRSGAKLYYHDNGNFSIYCYASDGADAVAAAEELKLGMALHAAREQFNLTIRRAPRSPRTPELNFSIEYRF